MDVAPPPAAAAPMMLPPPPTLPTSPPRTPWKGPPRKHLGKHPSLNNFWNGKKRKASWKGVIPKSL
jgi:hypothetical protein